MDKLYYIFYSPLKKGLAHAERASFLLSIFFSLAFGCLYFLSAILLDLRFSNGYVFAAIMAIVFALIFMFNSRFFVKTGRYRRIVDKYGMISKLSKRRKLFNLILILFLILGSFILFAWSGILLSEYRS